MDSTMFDDMTRAVRERLTRRALGRMAGAGALGAAAAPVLGDATEARKKTRKRRAAAEHNVRGNKAIMCVNGVTTRVPKNKRKKYLKQGATRGECAAPNPTCVPTCPAGSCNIDDGCGGTCPGCAAGAVCAEGVCQACDVFCDLGTQTPGECGEALNIALAGGGDVYVCPGRYQGTFVTPLNTNVYGAGSGDDPAVDTILDGNNVNIVFYSFGNDITFLLSGARVTNGASGSSGGAFFMDDIGLSVTLRDCVVTGNTSRYGSAFFVYYGTLTLDGCEITGNTITAGGYGTIYWDSDSTTLTITNTNITTNTGGTNGGGIYASDGTVTLAASVNITGNTVTGSGGGIYDNGADAINVNGANISGNTPDNCDPNTLC